MPPLSVVQRHAMHECQCSVAGSRGARGPVTVKAVMILAPVESVRMAPDAVAIGLRGDHSGPSS